MTPSCVLFDCDGVIVDSEGPAFDLLRADLADHGLMVDEDNLQRLFLGGTVAGLFLKAREMGARLPEGWVDAFYARLYARLAQGVALISGVEAVMDRLDRAGIPYAVGSNGSDRKMQITLGQHPQVLSRLKGHLYSGQTLGRPKPAPDLYLHAAAQLQANPSRAVVIEDSPTGARAARAAGMRCLGYAPHGNPALAAEGAALFSAMDQLPDLLGL